MYYIFMQDIVILYKLYRYTLFQSIVAPDNFEQVFGITLIPEIRQDKLKRWDAIIAATRKRILTNLRQIERHKTDNMI